MKKILTLLLIISLSTTVLAQGELNARETGFLRAEISITSSVQASKQLNDFELTFYGVPQNDSFQVTGPDDSLIKTDELGNEFYELNWSEYSGGEYVLSGVIENTAVFSNVKRVPFPYNAPSDLSLYLDSTETSIITPELRNKAREIVGDAEDGFTAVSRLSHWVFTNVEYDLTYLGQHSDSVEIFNNKKGVCAEFTTLFVALARSVGIPARYVGGIVYGQGGDWSYHAWAEVYLDGWIPVDPTWNEVGWLDATHIRFGAFPDGQDLLTKATYTFTGSSPRVSIDASPRVSVEVLNTRPISKVFTVSSEVFPSKIGVGDSAVTEVVVKNDGPGCLATSTEVRSRVDSKGDPVIETEGEKLVALCSGDETKVHFVMNSRADLRENAIYYNLADVLTFLGNDLIVDLTIDPTERKTSSLDLVLSSQTVTKGSKVSFEADSSARTVKFYSDLEFDEGAGLIDASVVGDHYFIAVTDSGEVSRKELRVESDLSFVIEGISKSSNLECGDSVDLSFTVENLKGAADFDVRVNTSEDLEGVQVPGFELGEGESKSITLNSKLAEDCSGEDQFIKVLVNDQVFQEKITLKPAEPKLSERVTTTISDAGSVLQGLVDWVVGLFAGLLKAFS